jgi:hypothetical protein
MTEGGPLAGVKKRLNEIKEKYKLDELQRDIIEFEKITNEEVNKLLSDLGPENEGYVIVMDEVKTVKKLIGVSKEEDGKGQENLYSVSKEFRGIFGKIEDGLSYTEEAWYSFEPKKESEKHGEVKNDG